MKEMKESFESSLGGELPPPTGKFPPSLNSETLLAVLQKIQLASSMKMRDAFKKLRDEGYLFSSQN